MILFNPTDHTIKDFPIENTKTGEVFQWTIKPGETLDFPDYAGTYLLEIYGFLQRVVTQEQLDKEAIEKKKVSAGQHFSQVRIVPSEQVKIPEPEVSQKEDPLEGFTTEAVRGKSELPTQQ